MIPTYSHKCSLMRILFNAGNPGSQFVKLTRISNHDLQLDQE